MAIKLTSGFYLALGLFILSGCGDKQLQENGVALPLKNATFDEVIEKSNCMACHLPENHVGAPSWKAVSKRYKGDVSAASFLTHKVAQGGSGSWGKTDMPPYKELSEAELKLLVWGILATK